jgi:peroxiredoxin
VEHATTDRARLDAGKELGGSLGVLAALAAVAAVILFGFGTGRDERLAALAPQLVTDRPAPDFELPDREGHMHRLADLRGRPVVLNFWSIDCPPCLRELPSLEGLARAGRERGTFSVVTVSVEGSWSDVERAFPDGTEMVVLFDPERDVVQGQYGTEMYPETFLIDSSGSIRARFDGERDWSDPDVRDLVESL